MSKCNLCIERPEDFKKDLWEILNGKLMKILVEKHDINQGSDECCNWFFYEFLTARQIKDIAVMVFGNDLPYTLKVVTNLRIIGDGACPGCGSNDRSEIN